MKKATELTLAITCHEYFVAGDLTFIVFCVGSSMAACYHLALVGQNAVIGTGKPFVVQRR